MPVPLPLIQLAAIVVVVTAAIETVQWFLVFRRPNFQSLKKRIAMQHNDPEALKPSAPVKIAKSHKEKKQERLQNQMANQTSSTFSSMNFWTKGVGAVFMFGTYQLVARWLDNVTVAKLPFEPQGFFKNFTHRRLEGTDWTAASVTFMFTLCTMSLKANMTQLLQLGPDRAMTVLRQHWDLIKKAQGQDVKTTAVHLKVMMQNQRKMWHSSQDHAKKLFGDPKLA